MDNPSSSTLDPLAASEQPQDTAAPKVPERVYDLYSWTTNSPKSRLVYIRDHEMAEHELSQLRPGPLGFDLEWKPNYFKGGIENPVALVQLASEDKILLIQVTAMRMFGFPRVLQNVLENPAFSKAGVSILNDCKKLWADYRINVRNCTDLGLLARTVDNARWKGKYSNPIGLARLCETYHELSLHKGRVTRSNWEAVLSPIQQEYAANDCHSGLTLFNKLHPLLETINPKPLPAFYSFDVFEGYPYHPSIYPLPVILWQPHNPFYDPGPPPPPKVPKEKKVKNGENATAGAGGNEASSASSPRPDRVDNRAQRQPSRPSTRTASAHSLSTAGALPVDPTGLGTSLQAVHPPLRSGSHHPQGPGVSRGTGSRFNPSRGGRGWRPGRGGAGRGRGRDRRIGAAEPANTNV